MEMTRQAAEERWRASRRRDGELASLSAHLSAATARWLELAWELREDGDVDDPGLVVHIDAVALSSACDGRSELQERPRHLPGDGAPVGLRRRAGGPGRARWAAVQRRAQAAYGAAGASAAARGARRPELLLSRLRAPPAPAGAPPPTLGARRRDEPREPRAALLPAPPARARGRLHGRGRPRRRASLPQPPRSRLPNTPVQTAARKLGRGARRPPPARAQNRPANQPQR
jgi:hypothetical protein